MPQPAPAPARAPSSAARRGAAPRPSCRRPVSPPSPGQAAPGAGPPPRRRRGSAAAMRVTALSRARRASPRAAAAQIPARCPAPRCRPAGPAERGSERVGSGRAEPGREAAAAAGIPCAPPRAATAPQLPRPLRLRRRPPGRGFGARPRRLPPPRGPPRPPNVPAGRGPCRRPPRVRVGVRGGVEASAVKPRSSHVVCGGTSDSRPRCGLLGPGFRRGKVASCSSELSSPPPTTTTPSFLVKARTCSWPVCTPGLILLLCQPLSQENKRSGETWPACGKITYPVLRLARRKLPRKDWGVV